MCSCKFKFTWACDEEMALLRDRSISPMWNGIIAQQEFALKFTANLELIRSSNFRADISPAHVVCTIQEEDLAIFSVSYCAHISTVSDTVLPVFQFPPYWSCAMLFDTVFHLLPLDHSRDFFFLHITTNTTQGTEQYIRCEQDKYQHECYYYYYYYVCQFI